jgi:CrcB protein
VERFLLVGVGGFIGSTLRYTLGGLILRLKSGSLFPWETLAVNVIGCLVIGVLAGLSESRGLFAGTTRVFLFVGVLGGFTTFSSFGYETFELLRDGQWGSAVTSVALQLVLGLGGVWAGHTVAWSWGGH